MKVIKLILVLYKVNLLSPSSIVYLLKALFHSGMNLMTLLEVAAIRYGNQIAIVDDESTITYKDLLYKSNSLANYFSSGLNLHKGKKVAILCRNHISLIQTIFAVSRVGSDIYFLNIEIGKEQLKELVKYGKYDVLVYDFEFNCLIESLDFTGVKFICNKNINHNTSTDLPRVSSGKIILQTGGTTGKPKEARHKPSLFNYLDPFIAFIQKLKVSDYQTAYIGTPIFHGYGIAVLLLFIPLGKKLVITSRFKAYEACKLIENNQVEFITVVPVMLDRMLQCNVKELSSLRCIASGGAKLNSKLVRRTLNHLGDVLYNLYGTSEAGLNIIAGPKDLQYSPNTLGRKIAGVHLKLVDRNGHNVKTGVIGEFVVRNSWSMKNKNKGWIRTGDMGYKDKNGYLFLSGRTDEMIISGGENVFPNNVEQTLYDHPQIEDAIVIGVKDKEYGQRLKAFVKTKGLTEHDIRIWLKDRIARYQMPKEIIIVNEIPYTPVGKPDKKRLIENEINRAKL
ncbi:AMP-binding protein [Paucisalibacillus sp. EB02]|uniref:AMP-binding protein n=1 Tax=Paucisalibacillus sp. EB02 TaxID=1347087 RepID=UPI0005AAD992|nr:AMP-binding protein [Paucisalibacillus sp. EB02]